MSGMYRPNLTRRRFSRIVEEAYRGAPREAIEAWRIHRKREHAWIKTVLIPMAEEQARLAISKILSRAMEAIRVNAVMPSLNITNPERNVDSTISVPVLPDQWKECKFKVTEEEMIQMEHQIKEEWKASLARRDEFEGMTDDMIKRRNHD